MIILLADVACLRGGSGDEVVHVIAKPAILLNEQFNWSHVIKTTNRKLGICCVAWILKLSQHGPYRACCGSLTGWDETYTSICHWVCSAWLYRAQGL